MLALERANNHLVAFRQRVMEWRFLIADGATAASQMAIDEALAVSGRPTLRLFRWRNPAISLGVRQQAPPWCDRSTLATHGIESIHRPTGGGLAVHGSDLSSSVTLPVTTQLPLGEVMRLVCESFTDALRALRIPVQWIEDIDRAGRIEHCLTDPSPYALMIGTRKVGGFAIRRYPTSWLVQGSLLVHPFPEVFRRVMPYPVWRVFQERAIALDDARGNAVADDELIEQLNNSWRGTWGIPCVWTRLREEASRSDAV